MQKLQDSVFTLVKTTNLSPAVFSFLQPTDDFVDKTPLGGILKDTKHGWLALGPKFCVVDLRTGMKVAARTLGATLSTNVTVTSVVELPTPLTENSQQLVISLQCDDISIIVVLNINGSQILRCIQTDVVVTQLTICDNAPDGIFTCFDGIIVTGTKRGEIFAFDLNRASLIQALKYISQGYEDLVLNELKPTNLSFLPLDAIHRIEEQRELALENDHHLAVLLNENSFIDSLYIFRNPDGSVRMKSQRGHIRVTVLEYIPQTGSVAAGFNFGAFQIWNLMNLDLEFTSQVNIECLPVTHFGFQEPCDDPRAFCYLWVIFSAVDRYEEEESPLGVMYSLTYQGKRMLSDTKCLYQDFTSATIRFQVELSNVNDAQILGGKCISCHTYSIKSALGDEGEDNMLNLCQLVWECWAENVNSPMQYGMLLFDLDQWYKDQMPSTYRAESNAFLSASSWAEMSGGSGSVALHARLDPGSVTPYSHATRLEEHFYPNSLQFKCICLNTSEVCVLGTIGIQRQIITSLDEAGPTALLHPPRLYAACTSCGLAPLYAPHSSHTQEDQRRYLLSVALEARLSRFLKRCAHDWATGTHSGVGCTLPFLVDWCWKRAIELKENAKELTAPLFISSSLPDRNIVRCLEHCVQQLTQLTGLMDAILTKCCNLVVPDALSEMEEKHKGIGTVSLYFQVVQWFLRVGLLPERVDGSEALPYPAAQLYGIYNKRRLKLNRIQDNGVVEENGAHKSCVLLYIDQLLEQEFGGERIHQMWRNGGSECRGLYPPPSLYALLRLYLLPDIAEEHKHSLVLYLLVDYSMLYDDARYETVIRRLMQFPTMFGLSNTAIKATQAFWHLDHRDFDFALDQLQCLTGNTLSEWQHNVVLSSLLAQKKTQAALQYLHVRKPAPIKNVKDGDYSRVNDYDKLDDWQSCCNLYLARGLVYEALDVIRMCVQNAGSLNDKTHVLNVFFKGCRNTGNLSKILSVSLLPLEEEVFIKYLENCNEPRTSDILIMYYLQQSRYLEAERYNTKLRHAKPKTKDITASVESLFDSTDREGARDHLVEAMCAAIPTIAETVAHCAFEQKDLNWHIDAPKPMPMSTYVQAKSSINSFTYKSSFIQDTIQNASETWMNRPKIRKGLKRMLNIEETPFICTPKLSRSKSIYSDMQSESTPTKRPRLNLTGTPKTPRSAFKVSHNLSTQMEKLLDMPEVQSPVGRIYERPETPHSILKLRRNSRCKVPSPTGSRYLDVTDDELELETASNHTHYSDTTNKYLRFTIPTPTELCTDTTPSPTSRMTPTIEVTKERERSASTERERDISTAESYVTTASHAMNESNPLESPAKKLATEESIANKKSYKDSVRARRSLSISANSSLTDDPNTSIESIADIPITLINPRYTGTRRSQSTERVSNSQGSERDDKTETQDMPFSFVRARERQRSSSTESTRGSLETRSEMDTGTERDSMERLEVPQTPRGRRGIRASGASTPLRSGSLTPERQGSPNITALRSSRICRSRSKTPELSPRSSPLPPIMEQPKQETESESHAERSILSVPRSLRSRSRTPERKDKIYESPKLEVIKESPTKSVGTSPIASPIRRSLRGVSRAERMEQGVCESPILEAIKESPTKSVGTSPMASPSRRSLRSRTPERISESPKLEDVKESPTKSVDSPSASPSRRSIKSRSRTPDRMETEVSESPKLEDIKESTEDDRIEGKSTDSPPASPSRRSLRSRSRTPEVELNQEQVFKPSPLSLRSRSKTPEKLMSPKREQSVRTKKSLSRLVLEANTFAKTKQTLELLEAETSSESKSESTETKEIAIECTPMKTLKQVSSLMDVTLSPIVNKSILQSSNDSVLSESVEKQLKESDNTDVNRIDSPNFTPLQETYFGKSVLNSYQSSAGNSSVSVTEEIKTTKSVEFGPMPAFTTIHEDFGRSILHSYESSVADSAQSIQEATPTTDQVKPLSVETPINIEFGSVLGSSLDDSQPLNTSSLITDDSDVEMTETENQERAEQKEKEEIVEIEREIHEIEDMSNENESEEESSESASEESDAEEIDDSSTNSSIHVSSGDSDIESDDSQPRQFVGPRPIMLAEMLHKIAEKKLKSTSKATAENSDTSTRSLDKESGSDVTSETNDSESDSSSMSKKTKSSDSNITHSESDSDKIKEKIEEAEIEKQKQKEIAKSVKEIISANSEGTIDPEQISMRTEDNSTVIDAEIEVSTPNEVTNPLDQAHISIMTDDNSTIIDDVERTDPQTEILGQTVTMNENEAKPIDPLAQASLLTEDNSESEQELSLNYSDEKIEMPVKDQAEVPGTELRCEVIVQDVPEPKAMTTEVPSPISIDVVDTSAFDTKARGSNTITVLEKEKVEKKEIHSVPKTSKPKTTQETSKPKTVETSVPQDISKPVKAMATEVPTPIAIDVVSTSSSKIIKKEPKTEAVLEKEKVENLESQSVPKTTQEASKPKTVQTSERQDVPDTSKPVEAMATEVPSPISKDVEESKAVPKILKADKTESQSVPKILETKTTKDMAKPEIVAEISKPVFKGNGKMVTESRIIQETETVSKNEDSKPEIVLEQSRPRTDKGTIKTTVIDKMESDLAVQETIKLSTVSTESVLKTKDVDEPIAEKMDIATKSQTSEQKSRRVKSASASSEIEPKEDVPRTPTTRKRSQSRAKSTDVEIPKEIIGELTSTVSEVEPTTPITRKRAKSRALSTEIEDSKESNDPTDIHAPKTRKRTAKTHDETPQLMEQAIDLSKTDKKPKTPITRKRTQSNQSEETTPENVTPSRRRRTPSTEVRKIITRRVSREMKALDDSNRSFDEPLTPKRLQIINDNESVASGSSMASGVLSVEGKRRGRKSTVATKPDLSVIPEAIAEGEHSTLGVVNEYSGARRLTRHQESVLRTPRGRRTSNTSRATRSSVSEQDEEDRSPAFDLQPIDRISLLNKETYEGPPDEEELQLSSMSPESIASDASKMRSRMARAASETKVVKAAKIHRRIASVDVAGDSSFGSPGLVADSPSRQSNRRASFNRAIEALHTPKGRKQSTDSRRSDISSPAESSEETLETEANKSRRGRRASNTSQPAETRSKKKSVLEESKKTKK